MANKDLFIEKRDEGDYAIRRANSKSASDVLPTQEEAIKRAKELKRNDGKILVERVRHTKNGNPDKWRKS